MEREGYCRIIQGSGRYRHFHSTQIEISMLKKAVSRASEIDRLSWGLWAHAPKWQMVTCVSPGSLLFKRCTGVTNSFFTLFLFCRFFPFRRFYFLRSFLSFLLFALHAVSPLLFSFCCIWRGGATAVFCSRRETREGKTPNQLN